MNTLPKTLWLFKIMSAANLVDLRRKFSVRTCRQTAQYRQGLAPAMAIIARPDKNPRQLRNGKVEDGWCQTPTEN
jgi:hypothetical protein